MKNNSIAIQIILNIIPLFIKFYLNINKSQILCQDFFCKMLLKKIRQRNKLRFLFPLLEVKMIFFLLGTFEFFSGFSRSLSIQFFRSHEKVKENIVTSLIGSFQTSMIYIGSLVFLYYFIEKHFHFK